PSVGPFGAIRRTERPGGSVALERLKRGLELLREARLAQHQVTAHLIDDVQLIDGDRTLLHAGAAARAGPQLVFGDVLVEEPVLQRFLGRASLCVRSFAVYE